MKLTEVWSTYEEYTKELTQHSRKLGFTGVAVCWLLRTEAFDFPAPVLWALLLIVIFFVLDACQYGIGAVIHYRLASRTEDEAEVEGVRELRDLDVEKRKGFDRLPRLLFIIKLAALSTSYFILLIQIIDRIDVL